MEPFTRTRKRALLTTLRCVGADADKQPKCVRWFACLALMRLSVICKKKYLDFASENCEGFRLRLKQVPTSLHLEQFLTKQRQVVVMFPEEAFIVVQKSFDPRKAMT
ncbi:uncharacterized protein LOC144544751 isoform X4 [Carex rostrata]